MNEAIAGAAWLLWMVDGVIALSTLELIVLVAFHRATGRGLASRDFAMNIVAGLCLMVAVRAALTAGMSTWTVPAALTAAGLAHATDIYRRWRRR